MSLVDGKMENWNEWNNDSVGTREESEPYREECSEQQQRMESGSSLEWLWCNSAEMVAMIVDDNVNLVLQIHGYAV